MAISGIKKGLNLRLSEIGKIKIGGKGEERTKGTGANKKTWRLPVKFGHFKVTTTERDKDGNFILDEEVMAAIGNEPKELRIKFPFDNIDMNFHTSYQFYEGAKLKCKGDGERAERKDKDGNITEGPCNTETCEFMKAGKCKVSGILTCYLPDSPHYGGVYRFRTHGWNSVGGILQALRDYSEYTGGILQGLPFKLKFIKKHTEEHGNVPVVALVMDGVELIQMRQLAIEEKRGRVELGMDIKKIEHEVLEAGFDPDTDAEEDVAAEFYNEDEDPDEPGVTSEDVAAEMEAQDAEEPDGQGEAEAEGKSEGKSEGKDLF